MPGTQNFGRRPNSPTRPPALLSTTSSVCKVHRDFMADPLPHRPKHRAHQLGVVVVRAMAKRLRYRVKHQPAARDDDVKSDEGQQGFGVEVHGWSLFCFSTWRSAAVVLGPLDRVPGIERRPRRGRDLVSPVPEHHGQQFRLKLKVSPSASNIQAARAKPLSAPNHSVEPRTFPTTDAVACATQPVRDVQIFLQRD